MTFWQLITRLPFHDKWFRAGIHDPVSRNVMMRITSGMAGSKIDEGRPTRVLDSVVSSDSGHPRVLDARVIAALPNKGGDQLSTFEHYSSYCPKAIPNLISGTALAVHNLTKKGGEYFDRPLVAQSNLVLHGVGEFWQPPSYAKALGAPKYMWDACFSPEPTSVLNLRRLLSSRLETEYSEEQFVKESHWTSMALHCCKPIGKGLALRYFGAAQCCLYDGRLDSHAAIRYYLARNIASEDRFRDLEAMVLSAKEVEESMNNWVQQMIAAEPRVINKIRAESEARGKAETILNFIRGKFGSVPKEVEARLDATPAEELGGWIDRVVSATSLDELLGASRRRRRGSPA